MAVKSQITLVFQITLAILEQIGILEPLLSVKIYQTLSKSLYHHKPYSNHLQILRENGAKYLSMQHDKPRIHYDKCYDFVG